MKPRKRTIFTAIAVIVAATLGSLVLAVGPITPTAGTESRSASQYISMINSYRTGNGLAPLSIDATLAGSAQSWANHMASTQTLAHDPNLGSTISGWTLIGENVGMGPTVAMIWDSFLASAPHRANLLNPSYTHLGVGFVTDSRGAMWTAHRFMRSGSSNPPPTNPPPTNPPPTNPPPTAPPVTAPANPGDTVDCTNFSVWEQANHWFLTYRPYYGDVGGLDVDGDGIACEELPGAPVPVVAAVPAPTTNAGSNGAAAATNGSSDGSSGGSGGSGGSSDDDASGGSGNGSGSGSASADPARVAEVIDALRALPS